MLKLPLILAPALLGKQVNNDCLKDSLLDKSIQHSAETVREFTNMVDNKGKALNKPNTDKPIICYCKFLT